LNDYQAGNFDKPAAASSWLEMPPKEDA